MASQHLSRKEHKYAYNNPLLWDEVDPQDLIFIPNSSLSSGVLKIEAGRSSNSHQTEVNSSDSSICLIDFSDDETNPTRLSSPSKPPKSDDKKVAGAFDFLYEETAPKSGLKLELWLCEKYEEIQKFWRPLVGTMEEQTYLRDNSSDIEPMEYIIQSRRPSILSKTMHSKLAIDRIFGRQSEEKYGKPTFVLPKSKKRDITSKAEVSEDEILAAAVKKFETKHMLPKHKHPSRSSRKSTKKSRFVEKPKASIIPFTNSYPWAERVVHRGSDQNDRQGLNDIKEEGFEEREVEIVEELNPDLEEGDLLLEW